MHFKGLVIHGILVTGLFTGLLAAGAPDEPVGLSLLFQNGTMAPLTLVGTAPRYLREIDLVATVPTASNQGIQPLIDDSELAALDWTGVEMVEEDWRPAGDGTFIRQRFYPNARWMEQPSLFLVTPTDDDGHPVGLSSRMRRSTSGSIPSTTARTGLRLWPASRTVRCAT